MLFIFSFNLLSDVENATMSLLASILPSVALFAILPPTEIEPAVIFKSPATTVKVVPLKVKLVSAFIDVDETEVITLLLEGFEYVVIPAFTPLVPADPLVPLIPR